MTDSRAVQRTSPRRSRGDWLLLAGLLVLTLGVGQIGRFPAQANQDWYDSLAQLAIKPPGWAFPVAWTLLFVLMAVAAWLVWRAAVATGTPSRARGPLLLWGLQLAVNCTWPFVFFGAQAPLPALLVILLLFALVRPDRPQLRRAQPSGRLAAGALSALAGLRRPVERRHRGFELGPRKQDGGVRLCGGLGRSPGRHPQRSDHRMQRSPPGRQRRAGPPGRRHVAPAPGSVPARPGRA